MAMSSLLLQDSPCASALNNKIIIFDMLFKLGFPPPPLLQVWETLTLEVLLLLAHWRKINLSQI